MAESTRKLSNKAGLPPGALVHVGNQKTEHVKISVIDYDATNFSEKVCEKPEDCFPYKDTTNTVSWINIDGLHEIDVLSSIGEHYGLHNLLLEDVLNTKHRPKVEEFDDHLFLTLKMLGISSDGESIITEQVSFVLGKGWVISFQEYEGDVFDNLYIRLRDNKGNFRKRAADYLMYRFVDTIVDNYFYVTEHFSEAIDILEEKVLKSQEMETLEEIQKYKKQLSSLRKSISPLREAVLFLQKDAGNIIDESTTRYLTDVYEHIIQVNETIESQREAVANIMDLYLSGVSNKMNSIMQVLTIIATIFIPLTFIAGIYGMNFVNIPELNWKYGYFAVWGVMLVVIIIMLLYFRRKRWL
ncbi:magnesium/cobalt transporter CorA [Bacteroidota bacterium]